MFRFHKKFKNKYALLKFATFAQETEMKKPVNYQCVFCFIFSEKHNKQENTLDFIVEVRLWRWVNSRRYFQSKKMNKIMSIKILLISFEDGTTLNIPSEVQAPIEMTKIESVISFSLWLE